MRLASPARRTPLRTLAVMLVTVLAVSLASALVPASAARAAALPPSIIDGGFIISDAEFFDADAMTAKQAQSFLERRVPTCKATDGPTCLRSFTANLPAKAKDSYCAAIAAKKKATAAEIIVTVGRACGINPQVILVMLQKEQGLVTSTKPSDWNYRAAMGMNCPDTAPCSATSAGFVNQVYLGARQQQVYAKNPTRYNYRAGQVNTIQWSPTSSCGTSKVFIENQATANLYIYTPYRPNVAALAAGYATGDACSTYGNRNFYNYYVQWFAPDASASTGAPAKIAACTAPASADVASASGTYTVTAASAAAKTAPTGVCTSSTTLAKGTKVTVTGTYGAWSRITVSGKKRWVLSTSLNIPAPGCAVPSASQITAASGQVVVKSDALNARKAPSTSCASGVITLDRDDTPTRTGIYGAWWRISHNGGTYWIHSDYAAVAAPATTKPTEVTRYVTVPLHLRTVPDGSKVVATLRTGSKVTVVGTSGKWAQAKVGSLTGWLNTNRLSATKPDVAATSTMYTSAGVVLRLARSASGAAVTTLPTNTAVTVLDTSGTWRAVTDGSAEGWVDGASLSSAPIAVDRYATSPLNVRTAPSKSAALAATLMTGAKVTVTGSQGTYSKITSGSVSGWVGTSLLAATKPTAAKTSTLQTKRKAWMRVAVSDSAKSVKTLAAGTKVTVLDGTAAWRAVKVGSVQGWMLLSRLEAVPATTKMTTTTSLNLRASASTSAKILATLAKGTKVTVVASKGAWRKVTVGSKTGWVHGDYLK